MAIKCKMRTAQILLDAHDKTERAYKPGTKAYVIAQARYKGITEGIWAMGCRYGAPFGVEMAVRDAITNAGPRPLFHFASSNVEFKAWQARVWDHIIENVWE